MVCTGRGVALPPRRGGGEPDEGGRVARRVEVGDDMAERRLGWCWRWRRRRRQQRREWQRGEHKCLRERGGIMWI